MDSGTPQGAASGANSPTRAAAQARARPPSLHYPSIGRVPGVTKPGYAQKIRFQGKKMGLCAQGLHHLTRFCPGRCTPFLTFLDHGLVQEAHSWLIHGLQIGEVVVRAPVDIGSCSFPSPCYPCPVCSPNAHHCRLRLRAGPGFTEALHHLCG